jgi:Flp pilus assembly pilin Flp
MALQLPRGLYRVDFALLDITTSLPGTAVLSTRPRRLAMTYQADTFDVEGGDVQLEQGENNERYELEFEAAGLELSFLAALVGVTLVTTGTGSTLKTTLTKNLNANQRSYGRLRVQQRDKSGGHTTYMFPRVAAAGEPTITANQGEYATPTVALVAYAATVAQTGPPAFAVGDLYSFEQAATYAILA